MTPFKRCLNCDIKFNDKPYGSKSINYCSKCVPLSNEELKSLYRSYLPVSKGYISYDDTIPVYWGD